MHSDIQDYLVEDREQHLSLKEAFYDSLEEDNSDNFSSDSLEYQKEKTDCEERSLALEKHRKEDSCSELKKAEGVSECESPKECCRKTESRITTVPFYKKEVTLTSVQKIRDHDCKADTRTKSQPITTANFSKQRKRAVKDLFKKRSLSNRSDDKGIKCFVSQWIIQANAYNNSQRKEENQLTSDGTLSSLIKDLNLTDYSIRERPARSSFSEDEITLRKTNKTTATTSMQSVKIKDHIVENKMNCNFIRNKSVSYLQKYRERKYGLHNVRPRPSPEGSSCSTCGNSSAVCLNSEDEEVQVECDNNEDDDYSFYMKVIINNKLRGETTQNFISNSEPALKHFRKVQRKKIISNAGDLGEIPTMGGLGPDQDAIKEKVQKRMKQKEYGNSVSRKNITSFKIRQITQKKTKLENSSGPPEASVQNRQHQRVKGHKMSVGQREQNKQQQRTKRRDASDRVGKGRKQEAKAPGDLLQTLQKRHLEEVAIAQSIRQQIK
ncbi:hypothetical protein L9F63_011646 [Diploptera punctata]|uniref:Uncharacterized protein n=1 Tax=Diploptera punctata TaxID=6984 RepID=A0AAD8AEF0_DIPPU|nr:hypothetical protein L9F63_011646 [Diploptera punctata]